MNNSTQNPVWAKLPDSISMLLEKPWKFGLFQAVALLEKHWANKGELKRGLSERVKITPHKALLFPASDVPECTLKLGGKGSIELKTSFSGLYGADSPMPHYVLEQAMQDDQSAARTRAFMDIFNHLFYCQLYTAWQKQQCTQFGIGSQQFDEVINAVLQSKETNKSYLGIASLKQTSTSGLCQVLKQALEVEQLSINDLQPTWQPLTQYTTFGDGEAKLGETTLLGSEVLVTGTAISIVIGPLTQQVAKQFSPNAKKGRLLQKLMLHHCSSDMDWQLELQVTMPATKERYFGEVIELGTNACLGARDAELRRFNYQQAQFTQ